MHLISRCRWTRGEGVRRRFRIQPLLLGFILGTLLSIGLRMISSPCWRREVYSGEDNDKGFSKIDSSFHVDAKVVDFEESAVVSADSNYLSKYDEQVFDNSDDLLSQPSLKSQGFLGDHQVHGFYNYSNDDRLLRGNDRGQQKYKQRKLLLVGVMTAAKYVNNRVVGVFETWAQDIPGRVLFFTGANSTKEEGQRIEVQRQNQDFTLIALEGVDDSYPPQRKSFMMLKYMYDHYGDEYEWFMRADDDVYVKADKLAEFLRSVNSRLLYFIGQAGKGNQAEKGTLQLAHNENFCMGGPGIILSRVALAKVAPYVDRCLQNMLSTHEDVEVGRCVKRFVGVSCTWAYEMQSIFYHNSSGDEAFTGNLKRPEVHRGITLHPVKDFRNMYRLHSYVQSLNVRDLLYESLLIQRSLLELNRDLEVRHSLSPDSDREFKELEDLNIHGAVPSLNKFLPLNESHVLSWNFLGKGVFSSDNDNPKQKIDGALKEALEDVVRDLMDVINGFSRVRGRIIDFKEILYGYHRVNPLYGEDFVLDLLLTYKKYRGRKMTVPVRRHAYIQRPFAPLQMNLMVSSRVPVDIGNTMNPSKVKPKKLTLILPLSGRIPAFQRFLLNFKAVCDEWKYGVKLDSRVYVLNLKIVYFDPGDDGDSRSHFFAVINSYRETNSGLKFCPIQLLQVDGEFSRGIGLETGVSQCGENDLLFLIDVDITFTSSSLERVLLNVVRGKLVYFPIVFSQYNPEFLSFDKSAGNNHTLEQRGYWRDYGFGIAAFYKSDFRRAGGFDISIKGWGKEDVSLYEKFINNTNLTIFRAPDPDLIHVYHEIVCDEKLTQSQYEMCLGTRSNTLGNSLTLMEYIFHHRPASHAKRFLSLKS